MQTYNTLYLLVALILIGPLLCIEVLIGSHR